MEGASEEVEIGRQWEANKDVLLYERKYYF